MAALIDAIEIKRKSVFELDDVPYACLEADVSSPTARGGQTLVRLKMRNLLTNAVFEKSFKAGEKFKEPDLELVPASYLYSDGDGSHFMNQETFETLTLSEEQMHGALEAADRGHAVAAAPVQRQPNRTAAADLCGAGREVHGARGEGRLVCRQRDQGGDAGNWAGDQGAAVYQRGRKGEGERRRRGSL